MNTSHWPRVKNDHTIKNDTRWGNLFSETPGIKVNKYLDNDLHNSVKLEGHEVQHGSIVWYK